MITSLRLVNFKNFADETLRLGPFTVIVGANASGKSNIRDAFRFLHGIGRGYTLAEILGGKYGVGGQLEWAGIRGAMNEVVRFGNSAFSIHAELDVRGAKRFYSIEVGLHPDYLGAFYVMDEELRTESEVVYTTKKGHQPGFSAIVGKSGHEVCGLNQYKPVLTQLLGPAANSPDLWQEGIWHHLASFLDIHPALASMRFLELVPAQIRLPSAPGATVLAESGYNLPTVLEQIYSDPKRREVLIDWVQELTPMDVASFGFLRDPSGLVHLQVVERNERKVSANSVSDGTLRFLAMLAALLSPDPASVYSFEEIDNGIHPNRLWLLLDFIERQTDKGNVQVITTTHSPALLSWMSESAFENASVVYRDQYWSDSVIRPIADLCNLRELRKSFALGELHTEGWIEQAMKASEGEADTDQLDDDEDASEQRPPL